MNDKNLSNVLADFETYLRCEVENKDSTVNKYLSETKRFQKWLYDDKHLTVAEINKKTILSFKDYLCEKYDNPDTINGKLGINHIFLKFLGIGDITVKRLKVVKRNCKPSGRYIKEVDYKRLIKCGIKKYTKAVIVAKIIANTGIRASEVGQITYEKVVDGKIIVNNKGKIREIVLNKHIRRDLFKYCRRIGIKTGPVILNNRGNAYTSNHKDIEALANILGHSSTETTLIYLRKTVEEYGITMDIWYKK